MEYRKVGRTGLDISPIALGCVSYGDPGAGNHESTLDDETSRPFTKQALDAGINFFDTTNAYSAGTSDRRNARVVRELRWFMVGRHRPAPPAHSRGVLVRRDPRDTDLPDRSEGP
jgi:aryl-alcohol dehydrogenase-like predicted oxidoreductase